jgi:ABC-type Mn2+/Zn2+ transport system permease subunit
VLGIYLVIRRVAFLGLVVANAATLGAALAQLLGWRPELLSLAASIGTAVALGRTGSSNRLSAESLMGWAYAAASSTTVLLLSWAPGGSVDTLHLLFGNVLAVQTSSVAALTIIALIVVSMQLLFGQRLLLVTFDPEAATVAGVNTALWSLLLNLTIGTATAVAVPAIGALATFALLTLPAAAALLAASSVRATAAIATILGVTVPAIALVLSFYLDLPAGPMSAALLAACVPIAAMANREAGSKGR